jgi:hypothetical protein
MTTRLRFPLADVLALVEHALAAPVHSGRVDDEPAGPALLLIADDGIYLLSNGHPQLPPADGQPPTSSVRAVFADGLRPGTPWEQAAQSLGSWDCQVLALPLTDPASRCGVDQLRAGVTGGHDTFTVTITGDQLTAATCRHRVRAGRG